MFVFYIYCILYVCFDQFLFWFGLQVFSLLNSVVSIFLCRFSHSFNFFHVCTFGCCTKAMYSGRRLLRFYTKHPEIKCKNTYISLYWHELPVYRCVVFVEMRRATHKKRRKKAKGELWRNSILNLYIYISVCLRLSAQNCFVVVVVGAEFSPCSKSIARV